MLTMCFYLREVAGVDYKGNNVDIDQFSGQMADDMSPNNNTAKNTLFEAEPQAFQYVSRLLEKTDSAIRNKFKACLTARKPTTFTKTRTYVMQHKNTPQDLKLFMNGHMVAREIAWLDKKDCKKLCAFIETIKPLKKTKSEKKPVKKASAKKQSVDQEGDCGMETDDDATTAEGTEIQADKDTTEEDAVGQLAESLWTPGEDLETEPSAPVLVNATEYGQDDSDDSDASTDVGM
jgi:hypothetical protein